MGRHRETKPPLLDWCAVSVHIAEDPKSLHLAQLLKKDMAWGYIVQVWAWCVNHARDGKIPPHALRMLEQKVGFRGPSGGLWRATTEAGFTQWEGAFLAVHNWDARQGVHVRRAVGGIERKRLERLKNGRKSIDSGAAEMHPEIGIPAPPKRGFRRHNGHDSGAIDETNCLGDALPAVPVAQPSPPPNFPAAGVAVSSRASAGRTAAAAAGKMALVPADPLDGLLDWMRAERVRVHPVAAEENIALSPTQDSRLRELLALGQREARAAYEAFLQDPWAKQRRPVCVLAAFAKDWERWVETARIDGPEDAS